MIIKKYSKKAKTKHIMPANLEKIKYKEVLNLAVKAHNALKCREVTRSDLNLKKISFGFYKRILNQG